MKYKNKIAFTLLGPGLAMFLTVMFSGPLFAQAPKPDTSPPSDVENVLAIPGDSKISLSWDVSTDNVNVAGYKIFYGTNTVRNEGEEYNLGVMNVEDVVTHMVENLRNGTAYYFAIVAVDSAGNESENYSYEISATPAPGLVTDEVANDQKNPEVTGAQAIAADSVRVSFSESIILPLESPEHAFFVEKKDGVELAVKRAELDPEDATNASVILITGPQTEGAGYVVVVDQLVTDFYENAVKNGENDRAEFEGFRSQQVAEVPTETTSEDKTPPVLPLQPPVDTESPKVLKTEAESSNRIAVEFSEPMAFLEDTKSNFKIHQKEDEKKELKVLSANFAVDKKIAYIVTDPQEEKEYVVVFADLKDAAGNALNTEVLMEDPTPATFMGLSSSLLDLIPPEDITDLIAAIADPATAAVTLSWQASKNTAGDAADQLLYTSLDKGKKYDAGESLGKSATEINLEKLKRGREYTWKVTVKDNAGNESAGTTVTLFLPKTGPGLAIALIASLTAGYFSRRKGKKV